MRNLNAVYHECISELDAIGIEYGNIISVTVNTRAKKRWGQCKRTPNGFIISVNAALLDERNDISGLKNTIIHEVLHTCEGCMNHGSEWKYYARKVNHAYNYDIKRTSSADEKGVQEETREIAPRQINYIIKCADCGHEFKRTRMTAVVKNPHNYRCACGGCLSRVM